MDVLSPSDPVEGLIMSLPNTVLSRLHDPLTQSTAMAVAGLVSFAFMGMSFFLPHAYAHVSLFHILIRAGLCVGLVSYVYREVFAKRRSVDDADADAVAFAKKTDTAKPRRAISFAVTDPSVVSVPRNDEPASPSAFTPVAAAAVVEERPQRLDDASALPECVQRNAELTGADSAFRHVPVPKARRNTSLIFDALNHKGMIEGVWVFVKAAAKTLAAATAAASGSAGAAAAAAVAADAKSDAVGAASSAGAAAGGAAGGAAVEYPEVMGVYVLGDLMCGHPRIVHGGLTSALLDQTLGISSFVAAPDRSSFTANLTVNYRKPLPANTAVAVRCRATKIEGRKLYATGRVELLADPNTLFADATALFVSPK